LATAIGGSAQVFAARFGEFVIGMEPLTTLESGDAVVLSISGDDISVPWRLKGTSGAVLTLC
jgi:hypothetical protein